MLDQSTTGKGKPMNATQRMQDALQTYCQFSYDDQGYADAFNTVCGLFEEFGIDLEDDDFHRATNSEIVALGLAKWDA